MGVMDLKLTFELPDHCAPPGRQFQGNFGNVYICVSLSFASHNLGGSKVRPLQTLGQEAGQKLMHRCAQVRWSVDDEFIVLDGRKGNAPSCGRDPRVRYPRARSGMLKAGSGAASSGRSSGRITVT